MEQKLLQEMQEMRDRCTGFLKDVCAPIKKQHSDNVKDYIKDFIKFPGGLSIIAVFFGTSLLVKNHTLALIGIAFIVVSLIIALNIFRLQINHDRAFFEHILKIETPMVEFSGYLTKFSRSEASENELNNSYDKLKKSYQLSSQFPQDKEADFIKNTRLVYFQINITFYFLVIGIVLCFLSAIVK